MILRLLPITRIIEIDIALPDQQVNYAESADWVRLLDSARLANTRDV